jgi:hypothetical protein
VNTVWTLVTLFAMALGFAELGRCEAAARRSGLSPIQRDRIAFRETLSLVLVLAGFIGFALLVVRS